MKLVFSLLRSIPRSYFHRIIIRCAKKKYAWFLTIFLTTTLTYTIFTHRHMELRGVNANALPVAVLDPDSFSPLLGGPILAENNNIVAPARKIAGKDDINNPGPVITLFTTMKLNDERELINKNTIRLWSSMRPWAKLVLFTTPQDDHKWEVFAQEYGWNVYPAPKLRLGVPVLKDMFTFIINSITPPTPFIGYANSDILFTLDLNRTLHALIQAKWDKISGSGLLMVGRRTDGLASNVLPVKTVHEMKVVDIVGSNVPSSGYSLDYFITTPEGYPWHKVPDFVVGKPGYDNWLVIKALDWKIKLIDLTLSMTALHQMLDHENNDSGWFSKNVCMNRNLFDPFSVVRGHSDCAPYFTQKLLCGTVIIYKRTKKEYNCMPEVPIWGSPRHITCEGIVANMKKDGLINTEHSKDVKKDTRSGT